MKTRTKLLILCAVLLLVCAGLLWQKENIKAGINYLRYSPDELASKMAESGEKIDESVISMPEVSIRPLTDEEREMLRDGSLSEEDALHIMLATPEPTVSQAHPEETQAPMEPTPVPTSEVTPDAKESEHKEEYARIAELIAKVYVMRDSYVAQLESIKATAVAEYTELPADQRTSAKKRELALRCIGAASTLESVCDAEMDSIVSELTALLLEVGGDTSIASDIKAAYANEKALKKAYYMDMYI